MCGGSAKTTTTTNPSGGWQDSAQCASDAACRVRRTYKKLLLCTKIRKRARVGRVTDHLELDHRFETLLILYKISVWSCCAPSRWNCMALKTFPPRVLPSARCGGLGWGRGAVLLWGKSSTDVFLLIVLILLPPAAYWSCLSQPAKLWKCLCFWWSLSSAEQYGVGAGVSVLQSPHSA